MKNVDGSNLEVTKKMKASDEERKKWQTKDKKRKVDVTLGDGGSVRVLGEMARGKKT